MNKMILVLFMVVIVDLTWMNSHHPSIRGLRKEEEEFRSRDSLDLNLEDVHHHEQFHHKRLENMEKDQHFEHEFKGTFSQHSHDKKMLEDFYSGCSNNIVGAGEFESCLNGLCKIKYLIKAKLPKAAGQKLCLTFSAPRSRFYEESSGNRSYVVTVVSATSNLNCGSYYLTGDPKLAPATRCDCPFGTAGICTNQVNFGLPPVVGYNNVWGNIPAGTMGNCAGTADTPHCARMSFISNKDFSACNVVSVSQQIVYSIYSSYSMKSQTFTHDGIGEFPITIDGMSFTLYGSHNEDKHLEGHWVISDGSVVKQSIHKFNLPSQFDPKLLGFVRDIKGPVYDPALLSLSIKIDPFSCVWDPNDVVSRRSTAQFMIANFTSNWLVSPELSRTTGKKWKISSSINSISNLYNAISGVSSRILNVPLYPLSQYASVGPGGQNIVTTYLNFIDGVFTNGYYVAPYPFFFRSGDLNPGLTVLGYYQITGLVPSVSGNGWAFAVNGTATPFDCLNFATSPVGIGGIYSGGALSINFCANTTGNVTEPSSFFDDNYWYYADLNGRDRTDIVAIGTLQMAVRSELACPKELEVLQDSKEPFLRITGRSICKGALSIASSDSSIVQSSVPHIERENIDIKLHIQHFLGVKLVKLTFCGANEQHKPHCHHIEINVNGVVRRREEVIPPWSFWQEIKMWWFWFIGLFESGYSGKNYSIIREYVVWSILGYLFYTFFAIGFRVAMYVLSLFFMLFGPPGLILSYGADGLGMIVLQLYCLPYKWAFCLLKLAFVSTYSFLITFFMVSVPKAVIKKKQVDKVSTVVPKKKSGPRVSNQFA